LQGPGIPKNKACKTPVSLIDLYPTFNEIAGLPNDPHPHISLDGNSMLSLLKDPSAGIWKGPKVALTAKIAKDLSNDKPIKAGYAKPEAQIYTVRSEKYRYIICPDGGQELYDCEKDPHQWENLASNPEYESIMKELHQETENLTGEKLGIFYEPSTYKKRTQ
jgi:arylsulfatase A-like enzyme